MVNTLSIAKLILFFSNKGFQIKRYFVLENNRIGYIDMISKLNGIQHLLIKIPFCYDIEIFPEQPRCKLIQIKHNLNERDCELTPINNDERLETKYREIYITDDSNNMNDPLSKNLEYKLNEAYNNKINLDTNEKIQLYDIYKQLKRLTNCTKTLQYSIALSVISSTRIDNNFLVVHLDNDLHTISSCSNDISSSSNVVMDDNNNNITNRYVAYRIKGSGGSSIRTSTQTNINKNTLEERYLYIVISLDYAVEYIDKVITDVQTIYKGLSLLINENFIILQNKLEMFMQQLKDVNFINEIIRKYNNKISQNIQNIEFVYSKLDHIESTYNNKYQKYKHGTDINSIKEKYKLESDLNEIQCLKSRSIDINLQLHNIQENIMLTMDNVTFNNVLILNKLLYNFEKLKQLC